MKKLIEARKLPPLLALADGTPVHTKADWQVRRRELLTLLAREEYGFTPAAPESVQAKVQSREDICQGKATLTRLMLSFTAEKGPCSFPVSLVLPKVQSPMPAFVYVAFEADIPGKYMPVEAIVEQGYAVAMFCYKDVTDDSDRQDGLAALYSADPQTGWGKIGMWAFACSRVMDYLLTLPEIDPARVCVSGHSRLGKTALWCAAQDERFSMAVANESGCSGAAISRGKNGETIRAIVERFPFWFCGNYRHWMDREFEAPFDQHMLLALIAPRRLYVCSAEEDLWAGPLSELLGAEAASEAWRFLGMPGLVVPEGAAPVRTAPNGTQTPVVDVPFHEGAVAYHQRKGVHSHDLEDWLYQMAYRKLHNV